MVAISDERLAEMLSGLDGVTPGPWDEAAGLVRAIDGDVAIPIFETREPWKKHRRISTVVKQEWHNRHHIARCDPDTMRSLLKELQSFRSQAVVSEAVAWQVKGDDGVWRYVEMPKTAKAMGMEIRPLFARPALKGETK